jgi:hypothetical protein
MDKGLSKNPVAQQLQLLLTGYGYNFYDNRNQARTDDLLVRQKAAASLNEAAGLLGKLEGDYQRRYIPPATRENPFPPAENLERLRQLSELRSHMQDTAGRILGMQTPTQDRTWQRFRSETALLQQLLTFDYQLIWQAEQIYQRVLQLSPEAWQTRAESANFDHALFQLDSLIRDRQRFLTIPR